MTDYRHAGFFVCRSPALPFAALSESPESMLDRAAVRDALRIASPSLVEQLGRCDPAEALPPGVRTTTTRYLARMSSRCAPFGLFAGISVGTVGPSARLEVGPPEDHRRVTTVAPQWLLEVHDRSEPPHRPRPRHVQSNATVTRAGDEIEFIVQSTSPDGLRYPCHVVAQADPLVDAALEIARSPVSLDALAAALRKDGLDEVDAEETISLLLAEGLLNPLQEPPVTGAVDDAEAQTAASRAGAVAPPVHVELCKQAELALPDAVLDDIVAGADVLARIGGWVASDPLAATREAFVGRYGTAHVPLLEALHPSRGLGPNGERTAQTCPVAADVLQPAPERAPALFADRDRHLLNLVVDTARAGRSVLNLGAEDVAALSDRDVDTLPEAFAVHATLLARSTRDIDHGEYRVWLRHASGPSGANTLGRFCSSDPRLCEHVRGYLRAEAALRPEALFAEIVYQPGGRAANIVGRPVLRDAEILYVGRSAGPPSGQIPVSDLDLFVDEQTFCLWSRSRDCAVVPRLSSAHDYAGSPDRIYRFLGLLQRQEGRSASWSWGALASAPALPRVCFGRYTLCPAQWHLTAQDLEPVRQAVGNDVLPRADVLRRRRQLPRFIAVGDPFDPLAVDFDCANSVRAFADKLRPGAPVLAREFMGVPDDLCATQDGRPVVHELVVPALRRRRRAQPSPGGVASPGTHAAANTSWVYAKLFGPPAAQDGLLASVAEDLLQPARDAGLIDRWFFVRYDDPRPHLRLRLRTPDAVSRRELLGRADAAFRRHLQRGLTEVGFHDYRPETRRYGGPEPMELVEALFWHDSEAALSMIASLGIGPATDVRFWACLMSMAQVLEDFQLAWPERLAVAEQARTDVARILGQPSTIWRETGRRFRPLRSRVRHVVVGSDPAALDPTLQGIQRCLAGRSRTSRPFVAALQSAFTASSERDTLVRHVMHMHQNRIMASTARGEELLALDFLRRTYQSLAHRGA